MDDRITKTIREDYDKLAEDCARHLADELQHKPFDRQLLDRFADEVRGHGEVCDMGCGPGHIASYLHEAKVDVFGLDLSSGMFEQARLLNPAMSFQHGDMLALDLPDGKLAGITAFYAIVNLPKESLPRVFSEMHRVLQPSGILLFAFHIGDETLQVHEMWGHKISMDFRLFQPSEIHLQLDTAGFVVGQIIEREPYAPEVEYQGRRAYIFARRPTR